MLGLVGSEGCEALEPAAEMAYNPKYGGDSRSCECCSVAYAGEVTYGYARARVCVCGMMKNMKST